MFGKTFGKMLLLLFVLVSIISPAQSAFAEDSPAENGQVNKAFLFTDLNNSYWGYKDITKMSIRGVVKGYKNGTFGPDRPVTQLEAVLMAVHNMEPGSLLTGTDSGQPLPVKVPAWAEAGCRGEILFALNKGLIIPSENNFNAAAPATRAWVTQLIIRMTGKSDEAAGLAEISPSITDAASVPVWAQPYVNLALRYKMVSGYPDKSFKPNQNVTRSEMVSLLSRSETFLDLKDKVVRGKVAGISGNSLFMMVNGNLQYYSFSADSWVFGENGQPASQNDLEINSSVSLVLDNSTVKYLEILSSQTALTTVKGTVLRVLPDEKVLVIKDPQEKIVSAAITTSAYISSQTGDFTSLDQVPQGAFVEIGLNADNQICSIMILNGKSNGGNYTIYEISPSEGMIILKNAAGEFKSFRYADQVIVNIAGQRFSGIDDLQSGDEVTLKVSGDLVTEIELIKASQSLTVSGKILLISPDDNFLTIRKNDDSLATFPISANVKIDIAGLENPLLSDLLTNDSVDLSLSDGSVTLIKVNNRSYKNNISGRVIAIDSTNRIITVSDEDYQINAYEVSRSADIIIDNRDKSFSDIKSGMQIEARLENNKIIYLENKNTVEGTISSIDKQRLRITIKTDSISRSYTILDDVDVNIHGRTGLDLDDVEEQDYAELVIEDNVVTKINLKTAYSAQVIKVSSNLNELTVWDEDGASRTLDLDNRVVITAPGIRYPDINDILVGSNITVTFLGDRLAKIELDPVTRGKITSINKSTGNVTIQTFEGKTSTYVFNSKCQVVKGTNKFYDVTSLSEGDRVEITQNSDTGFTFRLMTRESGHFQSLSSNNTKIVIAKTTYSWYNHYLASDVYLHTGTSSKELSDLKSDNELDVYSLNDIVYEIEIK